MNQKLTTQQQHINHQNLVFFEHLISLIPSKYLGSIYLNTLVMQFHFTIIPKGGCGTVDRDLESVYKKTSVLKIVNDDNNCFWYAMACMMNPDKKIGIIDIPIQE